MNTKVTFQILIVLSLSLNILSLSLGNCGSPAQSELINKTFIPIPGCIAGESYQTTTLTGNCTCWRQGTHQCGYICDNEAIPAPDSDTQLVLHKGQITIRNNAVLSRVRRQATCPPSPLPANSRWVPSSGCLVGTSYQTSTENCTCCGNVGYVCALNNPPTTTTIPTTTTTTTAAPTTVTTTTTTAAPTTVTSTTTAATTSTVRTTTTTAAPACPPNPFPANAQSYIPDSGCTLLASTTTQAIIISGGTLACICTSPLQCGMLCYSLVDGSNPSG